ncbi:MAG: ABC transporter ATP-binding protein [Candidatus Latescibacterota bacterium]|nr:ABC transporter ATP-binding protein [Candidatus Latescibacterota bacterium]
MFGPFARYTRPYLCRIWAGVAAITFSQAAAAFIPRQVGAAVDVLGAVVGNAAIQLEAVREHVYILLGLATVVALGGWAMRRLLGVASTWIEYDIRTIYFSHLQKMSLSFYQGHRTGDLMARATNDLNNVRIFFTYGVRGIAETALIFVFSIAMMCSIYWELALLVLLPLPAMGYCIIRMAALVHTRFKAIQEFFGEMSNFIQENLSGIRVVKAFVQGDRQAAEFENLNAEYLHLNNRLIATHAIYRPLSYLIASMGLGLNLWLGGEAVIDGTLSMGDFVAFNGYLTLLIRPIAYMGWVIDRFQRSMVAIRRINEILAIEPEIADDVLPPAATSSTSPVSGGEIVFSNVHFAYDDEVPVLEGIDLTVPAGSTLGIIGRVGSGKSTLARLIPRLIEPTEGNVRIDGVALREQSLDQLREAVGYVAQTPFLFSNSVAANIAYGIREPEDESEKLILQSAEEAQVRGDVEEFDEGFATVVGERGVTLSGGQKQRTTLARALLRRPSILILDDALSAVDTHTEEAILGHLRSIMAGRTTLLIAHRISTLRDADHIIVLDEGRIVEQGGHATLVAHGGIYADLYKRQQLAAELEEL